MDLCECTICTGYYCVNRRGYHNPFQSSADAEVAVIHSHDSWITKDVFKHLGRRELEDDVAVT